MSDSPAPPPSRELDELETLDADPPPAASADELVVGELVIGKYRIEQQLGRGSMGIVYLARDERLGRGVAIKIGLAGDRSLARAEREAQALAKLSHPNVVAIYEVGEHAGRLFVAMEYVAGGTARAWSAARRRPWRAIVQLYADAGAGLAEAHGAGIAHGDFKPDNVLVGDDGRPRVADFGLARAPGDVSPAAAVGTPAYWAPEQRARGGVGQRADQFAFCVSLWEALHGARPFAGTANGAPRPAIDALRRGLALAPAERWPGMRELVAELREISRVRVPYVALGLAAVAAAAMGAVAFGALHAADPCAGDDAGLAGGSDGQLAAYAARWRAADRAACRATHEGGQSAAMFDKRAACLSEARTQLAAVADALAPTRMGGAGGAVASGATSGELAILPDLDACANIEALAHEAAPPSDPVERTRAAAALTGLARTRTSLARHEPIASATLAAFAELARASGWSPALAEATALEGDVALAAGRFATGRERLESAAAAFLAAGVDAGAANAMLELATSLAAPAATPAELADARRWERLARGLAHRLHDPPELTARLGTLAQQLAAASER